MASNPYLYLTPVPPPSSSSSSIKSPLSTPLSKQQFLTSMLSTLQKFQYARSPQILRSYMKKTRQQYVSIIEANNKAQNSAYDQTESQNGGEIQYRKEKELNQRLEAEYARELNVAKGNDLRESQIRYSDKCHQMEINLFSLNKEIERLNVENQSISAKLEKQRFFREWQLMFKQNEGARSLNQRLQAQLQKKKAQIASLTKR